ncbi:MAG: hypothetical protein CFE40_14350 [Burkholderiales bacterium PBB1]|nr:MAG: hypothetical protein CFE40_14350 [Burkholderiales bacterium PBB1]
MSLFVESAIRRCAFRPLATAVLITATLGAPGCSMWQRAPAPAPMPAPTVATPTPPVIATTPAAPPAPVEVATPADLASRRALVNHEQLRSLPPNELAQEIARLSALPPTPETAIDLAMALLLTRNGGEQLRAIGLVEPLAKGATPDAEAWQPMARLLLARLQELRRLEDLLDRRNQELRDSQRDVKQLNEKLEALKAIERSLAPRPSSSVAPGTTGIGAPAAALDAVPLTRTKTVPRKAPS